MECKLCGNADIKKIDIEDKYYFCENCELIFIERAAEPSAKQEYEIYQSHENTHENKGYVNMFKDFINELLAEHLEEIDSKDSQKSGFRLPEPCKGYPLYGY